MFVVKRDGRRERVAFDKITARIAKLCYNLNTDFVDPALVAQKVVQGVYQGVTTVELDNLAAETAAYMTVSHPDYALLAARIAVSNLHKETKKQFSAVAHDLFHYISPVNNKPSPMLSQETYDVIIENAEKLNSAIIYDRDYSYNYFGFKTLERSYLLKIDGKAAERPQHMLMRVAVGIHGADVDAAITTYNYMSEKYFTHASPTLFNSGTPHPQLSSCFLLTMSGDSIEGIYDTLKICAMISKSAGGIGLNVHCIRAAGSYISGTNGMSNGLVPMLRVYNNTARYVDQGGNKRPGAFAIYLEPWHADVFEFLDLKKNTGKEEQRARDLFYALWIPDLFMKRVEENADWSLFCPAEAPGLADVWGEKFEELYHRYEREGRARKTIKAQKLWFAILDSQIETGTPFMVYKDAANRKSNQQNLGTIKCSNLCTEIIEYSSPEEVAVCNLASISLPAFVINSEEFDFRKLHAITKAVTRNLNKIIDINFYPVEQARRSNMRHRPIGLGVQGLADAFIKMRMPFESDRARKLNLEIFETIYHAALESSSELAEELGTYETYEGSPVSQGILQPDMWDVKPTTTNMWSWDELRARIARHGVRNSLLVAPMPTASTSQILGNNECVIGSTQVSLHNGLTVSISQMPFRGGAMVKSYRSSNGTDAEGLSNEHQAELLIRGVRNVIRLTMSDGRTITCTPDHRFLLADGTYLEASLLQPHHEILFGIAGTQDVIGNDEANYILTTRFGKWNMSAHRDLILTLARVLGFVQADGFIQMEKATTTFDTTMDVEIFINDCRSISPDSKVLLYRSADSHQINVELTGALTEVLWDLACISNGESTNRLPAFLASCPLAVTREFLAGFFGSNGHALVFNKLDGKESAFGPICFSYNVNLKDEDTLLLTVNAVRALLARFDISSAIIEKNNNDVKAGNGLCDGYVRMIVGLDGNVFTAYQFMERIGIRYSTQKLVRFGIAAIWSKYVAEVARQHDTIMVNAKAIVDSNVLCKGLMNEALTIAKQALHALEPILSEYYGNPNIDQFYDWVERGAQPLREIKFQYLKTAKKFLTDIGAIYLFTGDDEQTITPQTGYEMSTLPTFRLKMLDRRSVGVAEVYDINVDDTHNFLANGLVVHNCFEPYTSNIYTRRVLAGEFQVVNPHLLKDLVDLGLWNDSLKNRIMADNGSIQSITHIPDDLKAIYKTVWEISQRHIIDLAADRGAFIDQSQSLNIHLADANYSRLTSMHFYGWKKGLKTGMYYMRSRPAMDAIKFTVDQLSLREGKDREKEMAAAVCSLENKNACLSCSG